MPDHKEMLEAIQERVVVYDIHFRNAGVGFAFFEPPAGYEDRPFKRGEIDDSWKRYIVVNHYHPTLWEAIEAEYQRLVQVAKEPAGA